MNSRLGRTGFLAAIGVAFFLFDQICLMPVWAQTSQPHASQSQASQTHAKTVDPQIRRLILTDGSYQSITKYEIHGDRVRYYSSERGEWEEVPYPLIDWDATRKFEQGQVNGQVAPEAAELDKELDAERKEERARTPEVAPGLHLPDEGGVFLLDTYQNQPQLAELQQSGSDVDKNTKTNVLRAAINPLAGAKQTIEIPDAHAKVQSHTTVPSFYINIDADQTNAAQSAPASAQLAQGPVLAPTERFKIIRVQIKGQKRIAGAVKVAVTGKTTTDERIVASTFTTMTGGWVKVTPTEPLAEGEYAIAEMLGKEGMNLYVWDFGVNPAAAANTFTWKPDAQGAQPKTDAPADLQKHNLP
ncbi:MAG: hypothetical protein WBW53_01300 [Terriglobales bacterium]